AETSVALSAAAVLHVVLPSIVIASIAAVVAKLLLVRQARAHLVAARVGCAVGTSGVNSVSLASAPESVDPAGGVGQGDDDDGKDSSDRLGLHGWCWC
ncbi:hypothetical protein BGX26_006487, partial [Mortierella sp. AD094]